jgi:cytidylate kinase
MVGILQLGSKNATTKVYLEAGEYKLEEIKIAVDGPSGAGKSTISKIIASEFGFTYIDTGAIFRVIGLAAFLEGIDPLDESSVFALLNEIKIGVESGERDQIMLLDGKNVTDDIRMPEVSTYASNISKLSSVRLRVNEIEHELSRGKKIVMDGRDIGTFVFPDAEIKLFLTASLDDRAKRRYHELKQKGYDTSFETVRRDIEWRDKNDSSRSVSPLKPAEGAILVDTTGNSLEESIFEVSRLIGKILGLAS